MGVIAAALMIPGIRVLRDRPHGYTVMLASMLALYAITDWINGNAAMAVLTSSLLLGNASVIVPRLFPGASGTPFTASETTAIVQDQMTFLIKSFFFFMIGLMFPVHVASIAMAAAGVVVLFLARIPAVLITTRGMRLSRREFWFAAAAIPRGLAAGVLATIPMRYGIAGQYLAPTMFALIVFSILGFALAFSIIGRLPDPAETQPERRGSSSESTAPSA
jgi:potassium/hydrogen antiporter